MVLVLVNCFPRSLCNLTKSFSQAARSKRVRLLVASGGGITVSVSGSGKPLLSVYLQGALTVSRFGSNKDLNKGKELSRLRGRGDRRGVCSSKNDKISEDNNAEKSFKTLDWPILERWDVPWDGKRTLLTVMASGLSFLLTGLVRSAAASYLGIQQRHLMSLDERAILLFIDQFIITAVGLTVIYTFVNRYKPLPDDLFCYVGGKMPKWGCFSNLFGWKKSANTRGASKVAAAAETPSEAAYVNESQQKKKKPIISVEQKGNARVLKVVAICGSLRKGSNNRGLIRAAIEIANESIPGMEIELVDISNLPFQNTDLEVDGHFPEAVESFRKRFLDADCILFSTPEYNYSVTAPVKNAIDWASRSPNVMGGKPAAIMSVAGSLGGARAQYHLREIGVYLDLHFINKPELFVNAYELPQKFNEDGNLIDKAIRERVKELLLALQEFAIELLN